MEIEFDKHVRAMRSPSRLPELAGFACCLHPPPWATCSQLASSVSGAASSNSELDRTTHASNPRFWVPHNVARVDRGVQIAADPGRFCLLLPRIPRFRLVMRSTADATVLHNAMRAFLFLFFLTSYPATLCVGAHLQVCG